MNVNADDDYKNVSDDDVEYTIINDGCNNVVILLEIIIVIKVYIDEKYKNDN